jgi:hypothetical protein
MSSDDHPEPRRADDWERDREAWNLPRPAFSRLAQRVRAVLTPPDETKTAMPEDEPSTPVRESAGTRAPD